MRRGIRSYNAFLRGAKRAYGLDHKQAQQMYRNMRDRMGRPLSGTDLKRHPRISAQEAKRAPASERARRAAKKREMERRIERAEKEIGRFTVEREPQVHIVHSVQEWEAWYGEDVESVEEDWEGTPEYVPSK